MELSMQQLRDSYVETLKGRDDTVGEHSGKPDANYVQNDPIYVAAARGEGDVSRADGPRAPFVHAKCSQRS